jgi:hypothetical protein
VKFAGQTDIEAHRVLALRSIVGHVEHDTHIRADKAVAIYTQALAAAKKPAEKSLVIGALGGCHSLAAMTLVAGCLDDADLREVAAAAIVRIAGPSRGFKGLEGPAVVAALKKVVEVSKTPRVVEEAKKYLANIEKSK